MDFRWNDWNIDRITKHGVTPEEAEHVVRFARRPYPEHRGEGKWLVIGKAIGGDYLQVVFIDDDDEPDTVYIIHARPLTPREKIRYRKRIR